MLFLLLSCTSTEEKTSNKISFEQELLDAISADLNQTDASAFAIAVIRDGELVWSEGFGSDTKDGSEVDGDTIFRVASLTKPMTATVTLQQTENDCFSLEDTVNQIIEDFTVTQQPDWAETLTIKDTLQMSGGLVDIQTQSGEDGDGMLEPFFPAFQDSGFFLSPPGRMYNYSNTNFVVAGRMVELCTQNYFREVLEEQLWTPIGMTNTLMDTSSVVSNNAYALGVTVNDPTQIGVEITVDARSYHASHLWPAMGAWSSVNDMAKFALFLLNGNETILSNQLLDEMTKIQMDTEEGYPSKGYGYGLVIKDGVEMNGKHYPVEMWSHVGSIYGYSTHMYLLPEFGSGVIVLINRDNVAPVNSVPIAIGLDEFVEGTDIQSNLPTELSDYLGTYNNDFNIGEMIVTIDDASLIVSIPTLDDNNIGYDSELEPVRPDNFLLHYPNGSYDNISFMRDSSGDVEYLRHRNYVGQKVLQSSIQPDERHPNSTFQSTLSSIESSIDLF